MKSFCFVMAPICAALLLFSCAGAPPQRPESSSIVPEKVPPVPEASPERPERPASASPAAAALPERAVPERPSPPEDIMGRGKVPQDKMVAFLLQHNVRAEDDFVLSLSGFYIEEALAEGVNHDTAFAQMCLETGFLRYGGLVTPDKNNFCGLGAIGPDQPGLAFPDPRSGVRAHIQHLKAYATTEPLNQELVDPRYRYVKLGSSPTIHGLAGTWAADRAYSGKIGAILERLYEFSF